MVIAPTGIIAVRPLGKDRLRRHQVFDEEPFEFKAGQAGFGSDFDSDNVGFEDTTHENFDSAGCGASQSFVPKNQNCDPVKKALEALELNGADRGKVTERQVKKAFHKMALRVHPDKNPAPDAEEKFNTLTRHKDLLLKYIKDRH